MIMTKQCLIINVISGFKKNYSAISQTSVFPPAFTFLIHLEGKHMS